MIDRPPKYRRVQKTSANELKQNVSFVGATLEIAY